MGKAARAAAGDADEGAALDHAFLAAEIDALHAETRALANATPADDARLARAVRRRLHRLEAVLELHAARDDEAVPHIRSCGPVAASGCSPYARRNPDFPGGFSAQPGI